MTVLLPKETEVYLCPEYVVCYSITLALVKSTLLLINKLCDSTHK